jgi:hypothetical protein
MGGGTATARSIAAPNRRPREHPYSGWMARNNLSAPTRAAWVIAVILGVLGVALQTDAINLRIGVDAFWLVTLGWAILAIATLVRGL